MGLGSESPGAPDRTRESCPLSCCWIRALSLRSSRLDRASSLMERYRNVPMDFADATLVTLAEEIDGDTVFTLDRRGFETYRIRSRKTFRIVPQ